MGRTRKRFAIIVAFALFMVLIPSCQLSYSESPASSGFINSPQISDFPQASVGIGEQIPINLLLPEASGVQVFEQDQITLDYSNLDEGYVMVKSGRKGAKLKIRIEKGDLTYTYDLPADEEYRTFILSEGSGTYRLRLLEQVEGTTYSILFQKELDVTLANEFRPFLYPNQYVNFDSDSEAVRWAYAACEQAGANDESAVQNVLFQYVAKNISYDDQKAKDAQEGRLTGYLPDVDETLRSKKGICFDYSALLATMLRSKGIPTKLVTGYLSPDDIYHAWNMAYIDGEWIFMDSTLDREQRINGAYTDDKEY